MKQLRNLLFIAIGASLGALIRWKFQNIFIVNIIGSSLLGFVYSLKLKMPVNMFLGLGFCGALTSFSAWMVNSIYFAFKGYWLISIGSILGPLFIAFISAILGFLLGKRITSSRRFQ